MSEEQKRQIIQEVLKKYTGPVEEFEYVKRELSKLSLAELQIYANYKNAALAAAEAEERSIRTQAEIAADNVLHQLRMQKQREPQIKKQLADDRAEFDKAAKEYRLWSATDANFNVLSRKVGSPFDKYEAKAQVVSGQALVSPPTAAEAAKWNEEDREERVDFLRNHATDKQLRSEANREYVENHQTAAMEALQYQIVLGYERDLRANPNLPRVPAEITAQAIRQCDAQTQRHWTKLYGSAQLDARLHGIKKAVTTIDRGDGRGPRQVSYSFE
jgi:hypothetical protein